MKSKIANNNDEYQQELINYLNPFWEHKGKVVIILLISLLIAVFYIRSSTPIFEARGLIFPPSLGNASALNFHHVIKTNIIKKQQIINEAYGIFSYYLLANSTKNLFSSEILSAAEKNNKKQIQDSFNDFYKTLRIRMLPGSNPVKFLISAKGKDPEQVVNWLEKYLVVTNTRAINEILRDVKIEKEKEINDVQNKIEAIKETINNLASPNLEDKYLSSSLVKLQSKLNYYKKVSDAPVDVLLFRMDGKLEKPVIPVFPRKKFILILAFSIGLILSAITILMLKLSSKRVS